MTLEAHGTATCDFCKLSCKVLNSRVSKMQSVEKVQEACTLSGMTSTAEIPTHIMHVIDA